MGQGILHNQKSGVQTINEQTADNSGNFNVNDKTLDVLSLKGGNMKGDMTVKEPVSGSNPATKTYTDNKVKEGVNSSWKEAKGTLTSSGWVGQRQSINCPGLVVGQKVIASADGSDLNSVTTWMESQIWEEKEEAGKVYFHYYGDAPAQNVKVIVYYQVGV